MSVAPNLTEMLFAAGAADQVVAVSAFSDYPEAARALPQIGDAFRLDYERIVALAPTVAVIWETGTPAGVAERLQGLGIRVVSIPTEKLDDIATGVVTLGALAGTDEVAEAAARDFRQRIAALRERYRDRPQIRVFVQIDGAPLFTIGGPHLITEILGLCGGVNVFADSKAQALPVDLESVLVRAPEVILSVDDADPVPSGRGLPGSRPSRAEMSTARRRTCSRGRARASRKEPPTSVRASTRRAQSRPRPSPSAPRRGARASRALRCRSRGAPARARARTAGRTGG